MKEEPIAHICGVNKKAPCGYVFIGEPKARTTQPKCKVCLDWLKGIHWAEDQKEGSKI